MWLIVVLLAVFGSYQFGFIKGASMKLVPVPQEEQLPAALFTAFGQIKAIENNAVIIESAPTDGTELLARRVAVTKNTKIFELATISNPQTPNQQFSVEEKILKLSDLKIGDSITAEAKENIAEQKDFSAISIQRVLSAPLPGTLSPNQ